MSKQVFFVEYHTGNPHSELWHTLYGPFDTEEEAVKMADFYMEKRRPTQECVARVVEHITRVCYVADAKVKAKEVSNA